MLIYSSSVAAAAVFFILVLLLFPVGSLACASRKTKNVKSKGKKAAKTKKNSSSNNKKAARKSPKKSATIKTAKNPPKKMSIPIGGLAKSFEEQIATTYHPETTSWTVLDKNYLKNIKLIDWPSSTAATQAANSASTGALNERIFVESMIGVFPILLETTNEKGFVLFAECIVLKGIEGIITINGNVLFDTKMSAINARGYCDVFIEFNKLTNMSKSHILLNFVPQGFPTNEGSGGAALVCCMLSQLLGILPESDICVIGTISLKGIIGHCTGLKSKLTAAKRCNYIRIVMPISMKQEWENLTADIKNGLLPFFVTTFVEVFGLVFPKTACLLRSGTNRR
ncbi:hypothetical protein ACQ4LE_011151 [Meloidogyne hapla]|uniref:Lon proteolytic domain-containing protein n=1 Tax=Meloidogyne hapla TaxID=6305 RepID=A0A1I8B1W9_MELHA